MKITSFLLKCIATAAIGGASLCAQDTFDPPPMGDFGMIGGARGQTIRLNIVHPPPTPDSRPRSCRATIGFADGSGNAWPPGPSRTVDLAPGQSSFVQFDFDRVLTQFGQRLQLRPVVSPSSPGSAAGCVATAEIFDQLTGRTMAFMPPSIREEPPPGADQPPPNPDFGMVGGALLQVVRLNVLLPPGPTRGCNVTLGFAAADGSAAGPTRRVDLTRGQAAYLDLPMSGFGLRFGDRVQIRPTLQPASPGSAGGCVPTVEVFDQVSGRTTTFVPPPIGERRAATSPPAGQ